MKKKVRSQSVGRRTGVRSRKAREEVPAPEARVPSPQSPASRPQTLPLLLEIGCEEIPARFVAEAQKQLGEGLSAALAGLRLVAQGSPPLETYSTPRRLAAYAPAVLNRQPDQTEQIVGPPVKVAFDAAGKPTRAAESFAEKTGVKVADLVRVTTPKGEYLAARKAVKGRAARELLAEALPRVIMGIAFPKSMYWTAKAGPRFIRPIRWILALLGEGRDAQAIPFEIAGVHSGDNTFGHRLAGNKPIRVQGFGDYRKKLQQARVEIDPAKRRETVQTELKVSLEGRLLPAGNPQTGAKRKSPADHSPLATRHLSCVADPWLEDWVVNSTEWPGAVVGSFDAKFLSLPREILITVMRDHQKYFAVESVGGTGVSPVVEKHGQDAHATTPGALQPRFIAILNRGDDPKGLIRAGHERVLRARFSDAQFFWDTDLKTILWVRFDQGWLDRVTYREGLGTYADKVRRMEEIAGNVCSELESQRKMHPNDRRDALRAVDLCKCDLTTLMVREFPELQGIAGGLYLKHQDKAEDPCVREAVYDHYKPVSAGDGLPRSAIGCVVSLADKLDAVVVGLAAGLQPTGSSDPFGLRRAGNGIVRIAAEAVPGIDLQKLLPEPMNPRICQFLRERVEYYLGGAGGFRYDTVRAVTRECFRSWNVPSDAAVRAAALEKIRDSADFVALAAAAKRTRNILEKSARLEDFGDLTGVDATALGDGAERDLYEAYLRTRQRLESFGANGDYEAEFRSLAALRPLVDHFFDEVMVMDQNLKVRANRLRLLTELRAWVFSRFADLSEIESTASTSVGATTSEKKVTSD